MTSEEKTIVQKAAAKARELRGAAKQLEKAAGLGGKYLAIEEALGLRDQTHRHRIAAKYNLPINARDDVPNWQQLCRMLFDRMVEYGERPESIEDAELREQKLKQEIKVLQERFRKLENENELKERNLVDLRELKSDLLEMAGYIRKAGDLLGRKTKLTGRDAQSIVNSAIDKYERKLDSITEAAEEQ